MAVVVCGEDGVIIQLQKKVPMIQLCMLIVFLIIVQQQTCRKGEEYVKWTKIWQQCIDPCRSRSGVCESNRVRRCTSHTGSATLAPVQLSCDFTPRLSESDVLIWAIGKHWIALLSLFSSTNLPPDFGIITNAHSHNSPTWLPDYASNRPRSNYASPSTRHHNMSAGNVDTLPPPPPARPRLHRP